MVKYKLSTNEKILSPFVLNYFTICKLIEHMFLKYNDFFDLFNKIAILFLIN